MPYWKLLVYYLVSIREALRNILGTENTGIRMYYPEFGICPFAEGERGVGWGNGVQRYL